MPGVILEPLAGCIKWLPRKEDLVPADPSIEEGCCNHPVVVLSSIPRHGKVEILIITSFGGEDLEAKFPTQRLARLDHLPIAPSKAHPDNGVLLVLKDPSDELRKKSYVKMRDRYRILLRSLEPYNRRGPEVFLSKRSYQTLVKHTHFVEPKDMPALNTLADVYQPTSSPQYQGVGGAVGIRRDSAGEAAALWTEYYSRLIRESLTEQARTSYQTPVGYSNPHTPRIHASNIQRQPLIAAREEYRTPSYGTYTPRATTSSSQPDTGSAEATSGLIRCLLVGAFVFLAIYTIYRLFYSK